MAELLDIIAANVGTHFLSDLYTLPNIGKRLSDALKLIPYNTYPLNQWQDAVSYILRKNTYVPKSELEARAILSGKFKEKM